MMKSYHTSVEYKLTRFVLFLLIAYNIAVIIVNLLVKGKQYPFLISTAGIMVNVVLLYLLHQEKTYRQVPIVLAFFIYFFNVLSWLRIGGVYSAVPFIYLALLAVVIAILPIKQGAYAVFIFILTGILLSAVQILTGFTIIAGPNQIALQAIPYIFVLGSIVLAYAVFQMKKSLEADRVILKSQKLQLEEQYEEINQLNTYLEERVKLRTSELEKSQRDLQGSVKEIIRATQQMADYKLMALRSTMNPHFLYNSLNAIQFFIAGKDHKEAITYLSKFSRLIRKVMSSSIAGKNQLSEEIEMLRYYLELEQLRFEDKFDWNIKIAQGLLLENIELPSLLIQPFVENAILHGIYNKEGKGFLQIKIDTQEKLLVCVVEDNGIGREAAMKLKKNSYQDHTSVGVMLTRERLEVINRTHPVSLEIADLHDEHHTPLGTRITLYIELW